MNLKTLCQWFLKALLRQFWHHKQCDYSVNHTVQLLLQWCFRCCTGKTHGFSKSQILASPFIFQMIKNWQDTPVGFCTNERDLYRLEYWANRNLLQLSKEKDKFLHLRGNPMHQYMLGADQLKITEAGKISRSVPFKKKKKHFTLQLIRYCSRLPREVWSLPSCRYSKHS